MASDDSKLNLPVALVWGEDEFSVKQRARQIFQQWSANFPGLDHEIIDANVTNSGEALAALANLREALQTLPFFGSGKVVWFQNCSFLGDERTASARAVAEALADSAQELKSFSWTGVRLLITAGKIDKRKSFYKTLEKIAAVECFAGWTTEDRNWSAEAENMVRRQVRTLKKQMSHEAVARLVTLVGPNPRQLHNEAEKVALFVGDRAEINAEDVECIVSRNKHSRAFALGDALGARDLPRALRTLDEELWEMKTDSRKSEIGLLYGLITKIRVMIFLKEMQRAGWLKPESEYPRFKMQLERVPAKSLPDDRRFNPLAMNPYVLFKASEHAGNYTLAELVRSMELLLQCNQRLVSSSLDEAMVLQEALTQIIRRPTEPTFSA